MKKDFLFFAVYNIVFIVVAMIFCIIENNNVSFSYILLLLLISDFFIVYYQRKNREKEVIDLEKIEKNQQMLMEKERLSSLGQLIGGIAHNLKTPIMSISGALEGLGELVKEYDESIEDSNVTNEDHHEIARDMNLWIGKIKPYLSYMTDVIDTVKGQAVSMNSESESCFFAKEFISRTQILMKDELKRNKCELKAEVNLDENTQVKGELNALVQVLDNLILNAIDAYGELGGKINLFVSEDNEKIYIKVQDFAGGISENVRNKIFNEMVTSKGKNGTGLGLYISYSTIKGKFNGDMRFETKEGVGTTFLIELVKA